MVHKQLFTLFSLITVFSLTACDAKYSSTKESSQSDISKKESVRRLSRSDDSFIHLGSARDFNLFLFGDLSQPSSDTEGAVAVGGNANLANYSIGDKLSSNPRRYDLIVAGDLIFKSGAVSRGSALVGGKASLGTVSFEGELVHGTPSIDFKLTRELIMNESRRLGGLPTTSATHFESWGQPRGGLDLSGDNQTLNVFSISSEDLSRSYSLIINVPAASKVVVNISGSNVAIKNMDIRLNGTTRNKVLFNFLNCTQLHVSGVSIEGSILAPNAHIDFQSGVVRGQVIAESLKGQGQINNNPIDAPTEEPSPTTPQPLPPTPPEAPEIPYN